MSTWLHYLLHIDTQLVEWVGCYGYWTYAVLCLIIFAETGLIVTPFLPGDSLLFAVGSFAAHPNSPLDVVSLLLVLFIASIVGNQVNYFVGRQVGPRIFRQSTSRLFNPDYLQQAYLFYQKHGGKTIIMARFLPIIRTFVPFVAGMSQMAMIPFLSYNVLSAGLWVGGLLGLGYFFGTLPVIRDNFTLVIYAIIALSLLPAIGTFLYSRLKPLAH